MSDRDEVQAWLCLLRAPQLGPAGLRALLAAHQGSARQVLAAPLAALARQHALDAATQAWLRQPDPARLEADLAWLAQPDHHLLRCTEADFPPQLDHIDQPPAALFVAGDPGLLLRPQVAIVGARRATPQGLADAGAFASQLAATGLVVTSGLADGIDGAAHAAALGAGGDSIAVLGTGADRVYPRKHVGLAEAILAQGALVSEFPPGTGPRADHFPRRNRILAGLALGTVVIEAGLRSGSLITARLASEQGREVMAVPGSIHNPVKRGCHRLIRDGATLVENPEEVRALLAEPARRLGSALSERLAALPAATGDPRGVAPDSDVRALWQALGHDPASLDDLAERSRMPVARLSALLLELELAGQVGVLADGRYQRLQTAADCQQ